MSIRIGVDMDGVVSDFASAYREIEQRLFGSSVHGRAEEPGDEEQAREQREARASTDPPDAPGETPAESHPPHEMRRRRDVIWKEIKETENFWTTLRPLEPGCVQRLHALMMQHRWEVFFITERPATAGLTVQRQSQHWLIDQGFDLPTVVPIGGSRGAAAAALRLSHHVDHNPQHCLDVRRDSQARSLLIVPDLDSEIVASARKLGIDVLPTLSACLDVLEKSSAGKRRKETSLLPPSNS